jgi:hypothetical protein
MAGDGTGSGRTIRSHRPIRNGHLQLPYGKQPRLMNHGPRLSQHTDVGETQNSHRTPSQALD